MPLRAEGAIILGTGVVPAAVAFAQEADDNEDTLLGRESRLCWVCHKEARAGEGQGNQMRNSVWLKTESLMAYMSHGFTCRRDLDGDVFPQ